MRTSHKKRNSRYKKTNLLYRITVLFTCVVVIICVLTFVYMCLCTGQQDTYTDIQGVQIEQSSVECVKSSDLIIIDNEEVVGDNTPEFTEVMYTTSNVNLRSGQSVNCEKISIIPKFYLLEVTYNTGDDWYCTNYNGHIGYVSAEYLHTYNKYSYANIDLEYYYQDLVADMLVKMDMDVDKYFIFGLMWVENRFSFTEESCAGARGIMQIIPSTWRFLYPMFLEDYPECANMVQDNIDDEQSNIIIGMYYLKYISNEYGLDSISDNRSRILTTYNRGENKAASYYNNTGSYSSEYSESIIQAAEVIRETNTIKE